MFNSGSSMCSYGHLSYCQDQEVLLGELHSQRYFDVFEVHPEHRHWACFMCTHPEKVTGLMQDGLPAIEGQLKEKKGKWKIFKRWKTRYFTLSGTAISCRKAAGQVGGLGSIDRRQLLRQLVTCNKIINICFPITEEGDPAH